MRPALRSLATSSLLVGLLLGAGSPADAATAITKPSFMRPAKKVGARDPLTASLFNGKVKIAYRTRHGRFDDATQKVVFTGARMPNARKALKDLFGRLPNNRELAALMGAPDGATINIGVADVHGEPGMKRLELQTEHPFYQWSNQTLTGKLGDVTLSNRVIVHRTWDKNRPAGLGARVFATQAAMAQRLGIRKVDLYAELATQFYGDSHDPTKVHTVEVVGARVWPKLGFDRVWNGKSLLAQLRTTEGRARWEAAPEASDMSFNLKPQSESWKTLNDYMRIRDIKVDLDAAYAPPAR